MLLKNLKILKYLCRLSLLLALVVMISSCGKNHQKNTKKPDNLIKKELLSDILLDVYIIESAIYYKTQKGADVVLYTTAYYNALFKKHNITKKQFSQSMSYYIETDNNASNIFLNVINKLMSMQTGPSKNNPQNLPEKQ